MEVSRYRWCERVVLDDGSIGYAYCAGPLTDEDFKAVNDFNVFLKCQECGDRHKCALNGCLKAMVESSTTPVCVDDRDCPQRGRCISEAVCPLR